LARASAGDKHLCFGMGARAFSIPSNKRRNVMKKTVRLSLFAMLLAFALAAVTERSARMNASAQGNNQVTITNFKFEPKTITVNEGDTVVWNNKEGLHTVKSDTDVFVSKNLKAGETFSYQFTKAGKYPYHCGFHGGKGGADMAGTIVVKKK
jgi:plastocyanin